MNKDFILLLLLWGGFYFIHSLLASNAIKSRVKLSGYRLIYNFIAGITLVGVIYISVITPSSLIFENQGWIKSIGLLLAMWGVWITYLSFRYYDFRAFVGLRDDKYVSKLQKKGLIS